ncbi:MAG: RHS repeat-associated core domain-containing protein, partial [Bacteroidetes bacterium]|nr:RHS repeat-associated core domain-containing protein [Bacteroidota bacterium]
EYYPFGLQTQNSWTRDSTVGNNFLYDAGNELNTTTGVYETMFRGYDPALGRFMQVDPLAYRSHNLTPYHYAGNNPIGYNDPTGLKVALNIYDIINFLWNNTEYGGSWSNDGGNGGGGTFDPYDSQDEADSYNKAAYQQYQAGGGGSIVKQTTEAYAEYGTTDGAHVKRKYNPGGTTYVYVPGDSEGGSSNDDLSMSQVSQSMEDQFAEFVKFFFGKQLSQINATKNVTWSIYDPNVDLRGDYGLTGRRRDGSVHIGIGIKAMQDHKLLYITVEHELIHATDYILGVYDYFEQMVQHDLDWLGRDDLMGLLKEGNAYPTTVQTEIGFGTNYGFQQKLFGINAELKDVGLSYLLGR